ncbi:Hsp20/alpha crystallin family protein [Aequorivita echinoideorum]|uniref:Hsp20/alpha crystallin family protein n=1 Tax=Aequorivita echinoideorum TaxID=1549647 RepID=A0ABS5S514_9FLAO|nr:Hsp20/alpha crystallin family protein [Aequorivita echinoideorum]MBT0608312.1 Hsp20/alpha crystallin family protein [Aequorivita echinoideorum]
MKTLNNMHWLPNIFDNLYFENRLDAPKNYETFSTPKVNIFENLANFVLQIAIPGFEKNMFSIEVEEDTLKISTKLKNENSETENNNGKEKFLRKEFSCGDFKRSFKLPENVNGENITADYVNGILKITLPKKEEKKEFKKMVEIS